jgi:hypothetical protein
MKKMIISLGLMFATYCFGVALKNQPGDMNSIAESYIKLVLSLGQYDPDYVDAYYGPPEWKAETQNHKMTLAQIKENGLLLAGELKKTEVKSTDELVLLRYQYLTKQLNSLIARTEMLGGKKYSFDQETKALYDVLAPKEDEKEFQKTLDQFEKLLPGEGTLAGRYVNYRKEFIIPTDKLNAVFSAAITECRKRTQAHIQLPEGESFRVEYVKGKTWSAYNWYQGKFHSLIQVNTDLPVYADRAIDLAAHEGYPGHHVYNMLLEDRLVVKKGWREFTIYPLFSPQSLIA